MLSRLRVQGSAAPAGILVYHRTSPVIASYPSPTMNVTPASFRTQLGGLVSQGYQAWSLSRLLQSHLTSTPVPPRTFVITFDDGFESVYQHAWPILRELELPATVFLTTAFLDGAGPFPFDRWGVAHASAVTAAASHPLRSAQILEMKKAGLIDFGVHTHTHRDFRAQHEAFRHDLDESVAVLRSLFDEPHPPFAFPFGRRHSGYVDDLFLNIAKSSGVTCALTTEAEPVFPETDPFGWGRFNVYDWDTPATLKGKLEGLYGWAPRLQERISRYTW
jgi:peptidoglycan/xylan/chitin deacetylase (PgdA/CDA1 family)